MIASNGKVGPQKDTQYFVNFVVPMFVIFMEYCDLILTRPDFSPALSLELYFLLLSLRSSDLPELRDLGSASSTSQPGSLQKIHNLCKDCWQNRAMTVMNLLEVAKDFI